MNLMDAGMCQTEVLRKLQVDIRQEISPMVMNGANCSVDAQGSLSGMAVQFSAFFWENQATEEVVYTVPVGQWEWFKKRHMVGSKLDRFCQWVSKWGGKTKWAWTKKLFVWTRSIWYWNLFVVKTEEYTEKVKVVYPYIVSRDVPENMGSLSIPIMPDGSVSSLFPDARIKPARKGHVPIWVDQNTALTLVEESSRHRLPIEEVIRMAINDSYTLTAHRRP